MELSKETKARIAQAAKNPNPKFWGNDYEHDAFEKGYIAGGEAEAERAQGLYDCLKLIRKDMPDGSWFAKTIDKALNQYNNPVKQ